jgi:hypothetical protein
MGWENSGMSKNKQNRQLPSILAENRLLQIKLEQLRPMKAELARLRASMADLFYFGLSKPK